MPGQEDADGQIELLAVYRRSLSRYLRRQASLVKPTFAPGKTSLQDMIRISG
jgi:hypothetical protein